MVVSLCERFHCLPSQLDREDAELLRLLEIVRLGTPEREGGEEWPGTPSTW